MTATDTSKPAAKFPSFNWMRGVSDDKRISVIHRLVLLRLCIHRDEKRGGKCDPGYDIVARELGIDRKTVMRAVDVAVRFGWLAPPIRGRRENASFIFLFPDQEVPLGGTSKADQEVPDSRDFLKNQEVPLSELRSPSERVKKSPKKQASQTKSKASNRHGHLSGKENGQEEYICEPPDVASLDSKEGTPGSDHRKPDRKTGRNEKREQQENVSTVSAFDEFWASCPLKQGGKEKTRKAYDMVVVKRGVPRDKINDAMKRYAADTAMKLDAAKQAGRAPPFIKHPANWLIDGCYDDEPSPGTGESVTIDQHGNVIETPPPRRSGPQSWEEIQAEELAQPDWETKS